MKKHYLFTLFATMLLLAGCDYNEDNFEGFDEINISDVAKFEGEYTGKYPSEGYFTDKTALESSVASMLSALYPYCDKGSTAKVTVLFGDVTKGMDRADVLYMLTSDDYNAMGEEKGQPGKYDNFDSKMDVDAYLKAFLNEKYSNKKEGTTVSISYKFYANGGTSNLTKTFKRTATDWNEIEMEAFSASMNYTLTDDDYISMGTESGKPGKYKNFDSNMDVDFYLTNFLRINFPYTEKGSTCEVTYKYYANKTTTNQNAIYKYDGAAWVAYDPYEDVVEVSAKIAEMSFNGSAWTLNRLVGGSWKYTFATEDYTALVEWVLANKPEYKSTKYENEEYYFGSSYYYGNINNAYSTWTQYYNINDQYTDLSNEQIQAIMDERLAWGIANIILPMHVDNPDTGLSYQITYNVYGGRGSGYYTMSFMYNQEEQTYELVAGPVAQ